MTKEYFKKEADIGFGPGWVYLEIVYEWPSRKVENYGDVWLNSSTSYHPGIGPGLADQPKSELGLTEEDRTSSEEFEHAWQVSEEYKRAQATE